MLEEISTVCKVRPADMNRQACEYAALWIYNEACSSAINNYTVEAISIDATARGPLNLFLFDEQLDEAAI